MTTPVIEAGDIVESSNNVADTTPDVTFNAYISGDLLVQCIQVDDDISSQTLTLPTQGPNAETLLIAQVGSGGSATAGPTTGIVAWVGNTTQAQGELIWGLDGTGEQWGGRTFIVPSGEFDSVTPLGVLSGFSGNINAIEMPTPVFTAGASDGGGKLVVFLGADADAISGTPPTAWSILANTDHGAISMAVGLRDAAVTDDENITSVDYTAVATAGSSQIAVIVREPAVGGVVRPQGPLGHVFYGPFGGPI